MRIIKEQETWIPHEGDDDGLIEGAGMLSVWIPVNAWYEYIFEMKSQVGPTLNCG